MSIGNGGERDEQRAARIRSLERVAANIAHEFNNVLMGARMSAAALRQVIGADPAAEKWIVNLELSLKRGEQLAKEILRFGRPRIPGREDLNAAWMRSLEPEVREPLSPLIEVEFTVEEPLEIFADPNQLREAIRNLTLNARDAMPSGGRYRIAFGRSGNALRIEISDTGSGMTPEVQQQIFEPFFTTKRVASGLGLAMTWQIIQAHRGSITFESAPGKGTRFEILLPAE